MASPQDQATDLTTLTLNAVRALLREIAVGTHAAPGGSSGGAAGTYASFAAQALKDLMQCGSLAKLVEEAVDDELKAKHGGGV